MRATKSIRPIRTRTVSTGAESASYLAHSPHALLSDQVFSSSLLAHCSSQRLTSHLNILIACHFRLGDTDLQIALSRGLANALTNCSHALSQASPHRRTRSACWSCGGCVPSLASASGSGWTPRRNTHASERSCALRACSRRRASSPRTCAAAQRRSGESAEAHDLENCGERGCA